LKISPKKGFTMSLVFNIARDDFLSALSLLQNIVGKPGTISILSNVLIRTQNDNIELTGTDLEIGIRQTIPAEILSPGELTLPAKKLFEIVRESNSSHIHLEERDNYWIKITADSSDYNLSGMAVDEYPSFPDHDGKKLINVAATEISDMIEKTIFSVASDSESNFTLTGVLMEKEERDDKKYIRMISSDGHRLSVMTKEIDGDISVLNLKKTTIIPRKGLQEIKKFCDANEDILLGFEDKQAVIKGNNGILIIRLMNGDFPDYRTLIKIIDREKFIDIERLSLLKSMRRMNLFTEDRFNVVKATISKNLIELSSQSMDVGDAKADIAVEYSGEKMELGFNGKYFVETLHAMTSEKIKLFISGKDKPFLIYSDNEPDFISIIMPMQV
jgi:DNA polymerase III subunit beta